MKETSPQIIINQGGKQPSEIYLVPIACDHGQRCQQSPFILNVRVVYT